MSDIADIEEKCDILKCEEFEVLKSMYDSSELQFLPSESSVLSSNLVYKKLINDVSVRAHIKLSSMYPVKELPSIYVSTDNRLNDKRITEDLRVYLEEFDPGDPLLLVVILWINDNIDKYVTQNVAVVKQEPFSEKYSRLYIYSHHLYSSTKRSDILKLTKSLNLNGISTPGKPAIIIVEGVESNCKSFYNEVKSWNWQRIVLRFTDSNLEQEDMKFATFKEVLAAGNDSKHVNSGVVRKVLEEVGLEDKFNELYNI